MKGIALLLRRTQVQFTALKFGKSLPSVTPDVGLLILFLISATTHPYTHSLTHTYTHPYTHSHTHTHTHTHSFKK